MFAVSFWVSSAFAFSCASELLPERVSAEHVLWCLYAGLCHG